MQTLMTNTRGLKVLLRLNADRVLMPTAIVLSLLAATWIGGY